MKTNSSVSEDQCVMGRVVSISIGTPKFIPTGGSRPLKSSFLREPVEGKIFLGFEGFDRDQVADPRLHGGIHKAVCVYSRDHFDFWKEEKGLDLPIPAFGENLTVDQLTEHDVCIGDKFQLGEAQVEVSQPREPCHKINKVYGDKEMACKVKSSGYTGYYFRVLKQGYVSPGDELILLEQGEGRFSIEEVNSFVSKSRDKKNMERLSMATQLTALTPEWRQLLNKRLPA